MNESHATFLRELAERLFQIPVTYGVDQGDYARLREIAGVIDDPCIDKREEGEPMFVLLGRDSAAPVTLDYWRRARCNEMEIGLRSDTDQERNHVHTVRAKSAEFSNWRKANR